MAPYAGPPEAERPYLADNGTSWGAFVVSELSRKVRKLRRRVYRETPVATWNRVAELDWRRPYDELAGTFESGECGVLSGGAALALWRAVTDRGLRAWCYDFGFPE